MKKSKQIKKLQNDVENLKNVVNQLAGKNVFVEKKQPQESKPTHQIKLDKTKVYDLSDLTSEELQQIYEATFETTVKYRSLYYDRTGWTYTTSNIDNSVNAKELFYTLENIQVDCKGLSKDHIKEMAGVFEKAGYKIWDNDNALTVVGFNYLLEFTEGKVFVSIGSEEKTTITYEKFMELFGSKEEQPIEEPHAEHKEYTRQLKVGDVVKAWDYKNKYIYGVLSEINNNAMPYIVCDVSYTYADIAPEEVAKYFRNEK